MVDKQIKLYDQLSDFYDEKLRKGLKSELEDIKKKFTSLIETHAKDYKLSSKNSVHDSIYVSVAGRVKKKDSFREKLIRKNLGLELIKKHQLQDGKYDQKKGAIELSIKRDFDDILGLRIVCDLRKDCIQVFKLLKEKESDLEKEEIIFELGEMDNQPQTMKNGLDIFRIKGVYDSRIAFELQIKSKIEEAWGELDHFILYKDFSFFPSKDNVQKTMNNTGKLLDEIEHLLFDLRNSRSDYEENFEDTKFLDDLEKTVTDSIVNQFGFSYQLDKLASIIKLIKETESSKFLESPKKELSFDFLNFESKEHSTYLLSRKSSYELQILESIYAHIWGEKNNPVDQDSYDSFLLKLKGYMDVNMEEVLTENGLIGSYDIERIKELRTFLIESECDAQIWVSPKKVSELINQRNLLSDSLNVISERDEIPNIEEIGDIELIVEELNKLNALLIFEAKEFQKGVENINLTIVQLKLLLIILKDYCEEYSLSNYKKENVLKFKRTISLLIKKL